MQNFALLTAVGQSGLPVVLKRGFGCTVEETLAAAEYLLLEGNDQVVLCERGIRTFEPVGALHAGSHRGRAVEAAHPPAGDGGSRAIPLAGQNSSNRCRWPQSRQARTR